MCLIAFKHDRTHGAFRILANREEFHARPTRGAHLWTSGDVTILSGRDLKAGGTWLGVTGCGRWAALTNGRAAPATNGASRGGLIPSFLSSGLTPGDWVSGNTGLLQSVTWCQLLLSDGIDVWYWSNVPMRRDSRVLHEGSYVLGNDGLDAPCARTPGIQEALADTTTSDEALDSLACDPCFVTHDTYGTRCSTVVTVEPTSVHFVERSYVAMGQRSGHAEYVSANGAWSPRPLSRMSAEVPPDPFSRNRA